MRDIDVSYYVWNRFKPNGFLVKEELLGSTHEYEFENSLLRIRFPELSDHKEIDLDAKLTSWAKQRVAGGESKPLFYAVQCLYIDVDRNKSIKIDKETYLTNTNCFEPLDNEKQKRLSQACKEGSDIANRFFEKFSVIARWVTDDHRVCRAEVLDQKEWEPMLFSKETDRSFWIGPTVVACGGEPIIDSDRWNKISNLLRRNINTPIYIELISDARYQLGLGNIKRFISDLAVASKTYIRCIISNTIPADLPSPYVVIIEEYNIRPILTKVLPLIFEGQEKVILKKISSSLHSLFDARNMLFHSGKMDSIDLSKCEQYLQSVRTLLEIREIIPNTEGKD